MARWLDGEMHGGCIYAQRMGCLAGVKVGEGMDG